MTFYQLNYEEYHSGSDKKFSLEEWCKMTSLGTTHSVCGSKACGADANASISCSVVEKHEINYLFNSKIEL